MNMDIKCSLSSLHVFGKDESVIEGGTGTIHTSPINPNYGKTVYQEDEFQVK